MSKQLVIVASIASVSVAFLLILAKIIGWWLTGSLSLLSSLVDSGLDLMASGVNLYAIKLAQHPADNEHRFGHGKAEALAGLGQVSLILASSFILITQSVQAFYNPHALHAEMVGIIICIISLTLTGGLVMFQRFVMRQSHSLALSADSLHYQVDLITNALVLVSFIVAKMGGWVWLDPFFAILMSLYMIYGCKSIFMEACHQLMDHELPEETRQEIADIALSHACVPEIHDLRTRTSGHGIFIQFHMSLSSTLALAEAHQITEDVEHKILEKFPHAEIFIHQDPV